MTDIIISYEDGLRLSELYGQLQGYEYELANVLATHMSTILMVLLVSVLMAFIMGFVVSMFSNNEGKGFAVGFIGTILLCFIGSLLYVIFIEPMVIEQNIVMVEGQIDVLLAKYGMVWDDILNSGVMLS